MVKIHGSFSMLHVASPCVPKDVFILVYNYTHAYIRACL